MHEILPRGLCDSIDEKVTSSGRRTERNPYEAGLFYRTYRRLPVPGRSAGQTGEFHSSSCRTKITVGRLDSRFTGINQDLLSQNTQYDPQSASISPGYTAAFMDYFLQPVGVDKSNYYHVSAYARKGFNWKWEHRSGADFRRGSTNTGVDMAEAMSHNPNLKVLIWMVITIWPLRFIMWNIPSSWD